jgi:hypothetical protein
MTEASRFPLPLTLYSTDGPLDLGPLSTCQRLTAEDMASCTGVRSLGVTTGLNLMEYPDRTDLVFAVWEVTPPAGPAAQIDIRDMRVLLVRSFPA